MTVMNLDKLEVWARTKDFALAVYKDVVPNLPADEKWNLIEQLKRAAQSIPANIAQGHGRYHFLDNVRFRYIARGSLTEVQSHMVLARDLGYLSDEIYNRMTAHAESIGKQLNNYNTHGHKLRFPTHEKAQFVTALGIHCLPQAFQTR